MLLQLTEKNTNLGSVTGVNGKNPATPQNMDPGKFLLLPPSEYGSRKISATTPPPPTEFNRAKLGLPPPQMDVGPYAYEHTDSQYIASYTLKTEVLKLTLEASFLTLPKSARRDNTRSVTQTPREVSRS